MKKHIVLSTSLAAMLVSGVALAAGGDVGQAAKQATNWTEVPLVKWSRFNVSFLADFPFMIEGDRL